MKHYNITVKGRVQGVGFRYHTKEKAYELGVKGFVKNKLNRTVYIEAEAELGILNIFLEWCKSGPSWAYVEDLQFSESRLENFSSFEIR